MDEARGPWKSGRVGYKEWQTGRRRMSRASVSDGLWLTRAEPPIIAR